MNEKYDFDLSTAKRDLNFKAEASSDLARSITPPPRSNSEEPPLSQKLKTLNVKKRSNRNLSNHRPYVPDSNSLHLHGTTNHGYKLKPPRYGDGYNLLDIVLRGNAANKTWSTIKIKNEKIIPDRVHAMWELRELEKEAWEFLLKSKKGKGPPFKWERGEEAKRMYKVCKPKRRVTVQNLGPPLRQMQDGEMNGIADRMGGLFVRLEQK